MEDRIIDFLKEKPEGLMISEIADALNVHRHTITKYIYRREGMGLIKIRKVGIAKLCYLNQNKKEVAE